MKKIHLRTASFFFFFGSFDKLILQYAVKSRKMAAISNNLLLLLKQFRHISMLTSKPIMIKLAAFIDMPQYKL
jgi:hypothetical protein